MRQRKYCSETNLSTVRRINTFLTSSVQNEMSKERKHQEADLDTRSVRRMLDFDNSPPWLSETERCSSTATGPCLLVPHIPLLPLVPLTTYAHSLSASRSRGAPAHVVSPLSLLPFSYLLLCALVSRSVMWPQQRQHATALLHWFRFCTADTWTVGRKYTIWARRRTEAVTMTRRAGTSDGRPERSIPFRSPITTRSTILLVSARFLMAPDALVTHSQSDAQIRVNRSPVYVLVIEIYYISNFGKI